MKKPIIGLLICTVLLTGCKLQKEPTSVEQWDVFELVLEGPSSGTPFMDVELNAEFSNGEDNFLVPGFYDGNGTYRIRFSPPGQGLWTYQTLSNVDELSNKKGKVDCIPPTGNNQGPVEIVNTFYLQYADGTPYYAVGTTAYQWTSVKQKIQARTLQTLAEAPFNKIRMCVFPKTYRYGNETEPWMYPFRREGDENDYSQPNYAFFQNFDKRVEQLVKMGIQADVILFHPYDSWGYCEMGKDMNEIYVRYMIARLSAYRNVWWSLANEWDVPKIKEAIDWEGIGTLLEEEDPHQRLRGIHNWYNSEDHFYDHSRPWITHVSAQTSQFYNSIKWRNQYQKPLLLDEMRYEGDVPSGWGNLSGEEMASYFWMGGLSGGYPTHGDTYQNTSDDSTEVRWWAKGGNLVGESPERIAFFRSVMEEAPVNEMVPELIDNGEPENLNNNIHIFSKEGAYYLVYCAEGGHNLALNLPADGTFKAETIDTWNMQITPSEMEYTVEGILALPDKPYMALRIVKR